MATPIAKMPVAFSDVELVQAALADIDKVGQGLATLREQFGNVVFDVSTKKGLDEAKAARALIREPRYQVEKIRESAKAPLLKLGRRLDDEAKRIKTALLAIEQPIDEQIKAEEERVEKLRQAEIDAERARVTKIRERLTTIRNLPLKATGKNSKAITVIHEELKGLRDLFDFEEFADEAKEVCRAVDEQLTHMFSERLRFEEEQERQRKEREELDRQQKEQQARQAALDEQERKNREAAAALEKVNTAPSTPYPVTPEHMTPTQVEADDGPPVAQLIEASAQMQAAPIPAGVQAWRPNADELVRAIAWHFSVDNIVARDWLATTHFEIPEEPTS